MLESSERWWLVVSCGTGTTEVSACPAHGAPGGDAGWRLREDPGRRATHGAPGGDAGWRPALERLPGSSRKRSTRAWRSRTGLHPALPSSQTKGATRVVHQPRACKRSSGRVCRMEACPGAPARAERKRSTRAWRSRTRLHPASPSSQTKGAKGPAAGAYLDLGLCAQHSKFDEPFMNRICAQNHLLRGRLLLLWKPFSAQILPGGREGYTSRATERVTGVLIEQFWRTQLFSVPNWGPSMEKSSIFHV